MRSRIQIARPRVEAVKTLLRPVVRPARLYLSWLVKFAFARGPLTIADYIDYFALRNRRLFFVQIGACDGVANDPIHRWARLDRWSGILVEPVAGNMRKLKENYKGQSRLIFEEVAIAESSGTKTFYQLASPDHALPEWTAQLGSFERKTILSHRTVLPDIDQYLVGAEVRTLTLRDLLKKHGVHRFELMLVDCEGYDFAVVKQIGSLASPPSVIVYEHVHMADPSECANFLSNLGYRSLRFATDTLAYREGVFPNRLIRNAAVSQV